MQRSQREVTLLELAIVIIVLGLLAASVAPQVLGGLSDTRTAAETQLALFRTALDNYRLDNGVYPTTEQGLAALREKPVHTPDPRNWRGPYLREDVALDPWGNAYVYRFPGEHDASRYDLWSAGRDGKPGGEGEDKDVIG